MSLSFSDGIGCLDLTGNLEYAGTISTTSQGLTCQEWSSQTPHQHLFLNDSIFPQDGSAANAKNYCRDPKGEGRPWCYTTQPNVRWQHCSIPVCMYMYTFLFLSLNLQISMLTRYFDMLVV